MNRFLVFLLVIFIVLFIVDQSHFVEKVYVRDTRLGVQREEYRFNVGNLTGYVLSIPEKTRNFVEGISKKIESLTQTPRKKR